MSQTLLHVAAILLIGALLGAGEIKGAAPSPQAAAIPFIKVTYPTGTRILAELVDTQEKRARGLMFRDQLATDKGMLFVFEEPGHWTFWMKNTKVALDILWLGADKRIVYVLENVPGCFQEPCLQYQPDTDAVYVLEVPAGSVKREKLKKGLRLEFDLPKR